MKVAIVYYKRKKYLFVIGKVNNYKLNKDIFNNSFDCQIRMMGKLIIFNYDITDYELLSIENNNVINFQDNQNIIYKIYIPYK